MYFVGVNHVIILDGRGDRMAEFTILIKGEKGIVEVMSIDLHNSTNDNRLILVDYYEEFSYLQRHILGPVKTTGIISKRCSIGRT